MNLKFFVFAAAFIPFFPVFASEAPPQKKDVEQVFADIKARKDTMPPLVVNGTLEMFSVKFSEYDALVEKLKNHEISKPLDEKFFDSFTVDPNKTVIIYEFLDDSSVQMAKMCSDSDWRGDGVYTVYSRFEGGISIMYSRIDQKTTVGGGSGMEIFMIDAFMEMGSSRNVSMKRDVGAFDGKDVITLFEALPNTVRVEQTYFVSDGKLYPISDSSYGLSDALADSKFYTILYDYRPLEGASDNFLYPYGCVDLLLSPSTGSTIVRVYKISSAKTRPLSEKDFVLPNKKKDAL